jgi:hypothetical protein
VEFLHGQLVCAKAVLTSAQAPLDHHLIKSLIAK